MIGNTTPDAIKFMRDLAIQADTDAGSNVFVGIAQQSAGYPQVVMTIPSKTFTPTQDSSSAVDEIRVQVDIFAQRSRGPGDASAFETAHNINYALRQIWSRAKSTTGDYDNAIDSIQEQGGFELYLDELNVYQVSTDYIVRVVGDGTTAIASGPTVQSNIIKRKKITLTYADFATDDLTNTINLGWDLPAKGVLRSITAQPTTYFSGGSISAYSIKIGKSGELDKYLFDQDVFTGATLPEAVLTGGTIESMTSATTLLVTATSVGDNLDQATAGELSIWINYEILN